VLAPLLKHHQSSLISTRCHEETLPVFHPYIPSDYVTRLRDCHRFSEATETKLPSIQEEENLLPQKTQLIKDLPHMSCLILSKSSDVHATKHFRTYCFPGHLYYPTTS